MKCKATWTSTKTGKPIKATTAKKRLGEAKYKALLQGKKNAKVASKGVALQLDCK